jgi:hypothetical protein
MTRSWSKPTPTRPTPRLAGSGKPCSTVIRKADDPLLYLERKAYLTAIQNAIAGVEAARVVLAQVCQRLGGQRRADRGEEEGAA